MNIKNTGFLGISKIYEKGVMFLLYSMIAYHYGAVEFGEFVLFFTIGQFLFSFFDLGGELYQMRELRKSRFVFQVQNILLLKILFFAVVLIVLLLTLQDVKLILISIAFFLDSIITLIKSGFYMNDGFIQESKVTLVEKTLLVVLVVTTVFLNKSIVFIYLSLICTKLLYVIIAAFFHYNWKMLVPSKYLLDPKNSGRYLKGSFSYVFHGLLTLIFFQIDIIMLEYFRVDMALIGQYSAAIKLFSLGLVVNEIFFKQFYPQIIHLVRRSDFAQLKLYSKSIERMNIWTSAFICTAIILFSDVICQVAFGSEFQLTSNYLRLICIVIFFRFLTSSDSAILSSSEHNKYKVFVSLFCSVLNISVNYFLIPIYGIMGAIIATFCTELLLVVLMMSIRNRLIVKTVFNYESLIGLAVIVSVGLLSAYVDVPLVIKLGITSIFLAAIFIRRNTIYAPFFAKS